MSRINWSVAGFYLTLGTAVLMLLLCLAVPIIQACGGLNIEYSEGTRSGVVYKVSRKGLLWKTYEGEMSLGLTERNAEGHLVPAVWHFSAYDPEVVLALQSAQLGGDRVTLQYKEVFLQGWYRGQTGYEVTAVTYLPNMLAPEYRKQ
jgi:hypothetical protein